MTQTGGRIGNDSPLSRVRPYQAAIQPSAPVAQPLPANSGWFDISVQAEEVHGIKLLL
jgi:hypothetical protein